MEAFVIQIPTEPKTPTEVLAPQLRGVVEHVGTGRRQAFADPRELLAFLRANYRCPAKRAER
jgi:hypothetical protein